MNVAITISIQGIRTHWGCNPQGVLYIAIVCPNGLQLASKCFSLFFALGGAKQAKTKCFCSFLLKRSNRGMGREPH